MSVWRVIKSACNIKTMLSNKGKVKVGRNISVQAFNSQLNDNPLSQNKVSFEHNKRWSEGPKIQYAIHRIANIPQRWPCIVNLVI
jgi:hypothetical protein